MRTLSLAWLVLGASLSWVAGPLAGAATAASPDISRHAPGYRGIVFTRIPSASAGKNAGSQLVLLAADGKLRVLTPDFESAADPSVAFDGKRILFAGKRRASGPWDIFEMAADGSGVRQITHGAGNCRKPIYQSALFYLDDERPSYQIAFVSDLAGERNGSGAAIATNLYSVRSDGSGLRRLTYAISSSYDPFQMQDGRILFSQGQPGRIGLFAVNLDGTDYTGFSGPQGKLLKHTACVTQKGQVVFVESDNPARDGSGSLGSLRLRRNLHSYRALTGPADGLFYAPSPLPDGGILVGRRASRDAAAAIYRVDPDSGVRTLVFEQAGYDTLQPVALAARPEPDGHSSVVEDDQNWSKLYGLSVYENDLKPEWMPPGTAQRLRVIEGVPGRGAEPLRKRLLGDLELERDGSFHLSVPPNTPIQLQIVDRDGFALRTSAWIWAKNKENRGCIGCHEDNERTPENVFPQALGHAAADLTLPPERRRSVDLVHDVQPIFAAKCATAACHSGGMAKFLATPYVNPGAARVSRLIWTLLGRNTSRPWDPVPAAPLATHPAWTRPLSADEIHTIVEWIDLGAQLDTHPPAASGKKQ